MANGFRLSAPGHAWAALAAALAGASLLAWWLPAQPLDWQPALAAREPWRAWTAAFVHWSPLHLGSNIAAAAVVGALGIAARLPPALALAWAVAWPITQAGLLLQPALAHYGGLSGVLHAGVAAGALAVVVRESGRRRAIGAAILGGLAIKLLMESAWDLQLRHDAALDIAVAPLAHLSGALAGLLFAALALALLPRLQAVPR